MKETTIFPKRAYRTQGGAHVPHRKNTAECESVVMPCPKSILVPMQMHIGAPCVPTVKVGDTVLVGQVIGDSDAFVSSPIHASVSGTVREVRKIRMPAGECTAVVIDSDGEMREAEHTPPTVTNAKELVKAARACGLVGLGGAGFPMHVKLSVPEGKRVDTLIINAAECEPYLTADYREIMENSWDIISGIYTVKTLLGIPRVIIGVEKNKPQGIRELRRVAENSADVKDEVRVLELPASYPQGAEKVLVHACTGRRIPAGKLPVDAGCIVMNVTSIAVLARYIKTGRPLTQKRITVDGSSVPSPKNVIVPIGTSVGDVLDFVGVGDYGKLLYGGPMMGTPILDRQMPILKNTNGLLAFAEKNAILPEEGPCIRCGRCLDACPMALSPLALDRAVIRKDTAALQELQLMQCMECGSCAYGCPAGRHLVQRFRLGKSLLREAAAKAKAK